MTNLLYLLSFLAGLPGLPLFILGAVGTYTVIADQYDTTNIAAGMGALALPTTIAATLVGAVLLVVAWLLLRLARRTKARQLNSPLTRR